MKRSHLVIFSASLGTMIAVLGVTLYLWRDLPSPIPIHFNALGQPDNWTSKSTFWLFFIPAVNFVIYLLMAFIYRFPQYSSWPTTLILMTVEETKREKIFHVLRSMIAWTALTVTAVFCYLQYAILATATKRTQGLSPWVMGALLVFIFGIITVVNIRMLITVHRIQKAEKAK